MRELVAATKKRKPIIPLVDPDEGRGGMSLAQIHTQLVEADALFDKWEFDANAPRGEALHTHLFASEPIEWNRSASLDLELWGGLCYQPFVASAVDWSVCMRPQLALSRT